jgi:hypothetical protein
MLYFFIIFISTLALLNNDILIHALPEQIALNYGDNPTKMVVTWADFDSNIGTIEYGTSPDDLNLNNIATVQTYIYGNYRSPNLLKSTMIDLKEGNQIYYYRVRSSNSYSDIYSFKSHPGIGINDVTYHIMGDLGTTVNSNSTLLEILENQQNITGLSGGLISMGDLSYANGNEWNWDSFGNLKQYVSNSIPMMTTLGNHEWFDDSGYEFLAYKTRFDNPTIAGNQELYYSFDSGLVHWVMVAGYCK